MFINRLFDNPKPVRIAILVFVMAVLAAFSTTCRGAESQNKDVWNFFVAGGSTIVRGQTPVLEFGADTRFRASGRTEASFSCSLGLVGDSHDNGAYVGNQAFVQCKVLDGFGKLDVGIGIVALQNRDAYNGSTANFSLELSYKLSERLSVVAGHWSNAGTRKPNLGRDMLLLRWFL